jgi:hypothetical protein
MADLPPPRLVADDRDTLLALLQYQRESFVRKVDGIDDDGARRVLVPSGTTVLWLVQHLVYAEHIWVIERFAAEEPAFAGHDTDMPLADAVERYRQVWTRVDAIVARSSLDDVCRNIGNAANVNLRWVLMHLLEETSRHAGHADILSELIDGRTGR